MDQPSSDDISLEKADHVNSGGNMVGEKSMMVSVKYKMRGLLSLQLYRNRL
jgi:hypothetical protein